MGGILCWYWHAVYISNQHRVRHGNDVHVMQVKEAGQLISCKHPSTSHLTSVAISVVVTAAVTGWLLQNFT